MKASRGNAYSNTVRGKVAKYFGLKDDSFVSYAVEVLGGITMFLTSLALNKDTSGPQEIAYECWNKSFVAPEDVRTQEVMGMALATGISTLLMGLIARVPVIIGPGYPFVLSLRKLLCAAPELGRTGALAANLIVGICYTLLIALARKFNLFVGIPEDFRLGMAGGICAMIGMAGALSVSLIQDGSVFAALNSMDFYTLGPVKQNDVIRTPVLTCLGLILLTASQVWSTKRVQIALGSLGTILLLAMLSNIIRGGTQGEMYSTERAYIGTDEQMIGVVPSFSMWNKENGYVLFRYILTNTVEKWFNSFATLSAIALLLVISKLGYNKSLFVQAINDSDKITLTLLLDGLCNIIIAPFLGSVMLVPYVESIAGIVAGTKTGLGACVAAVLYLALSPCMRYVGLIFAPETVTPNLIYACIFAARCVQYIDFRRPALFFPSLLVFVFIPVSFEIGISTSVSFILLVFTWALTKHWICLNPQMLVTFGLSAALILFRASIGKTPLGLGIILVTITLICFAFGLVLFLRCSRKRLKIMCGNVAGDRYFDNDSRSFITDKLGAIPSSKRASSGQQEDMDQQQGDSPKDKAHSRTRGGLIRQGSQIVMSSSTAVKRKLSQTYSSSGRSSRNEVVQPKSAPSSQAEAFSTSSYSASAFSPRAPSVNVPSPMNQPAARDADDATDVEEEKVHEFQERELSSRAGESSPVHQQIAPV